MPLLLQTVQDLYKQRGFKTVPDPMFAASQTVPALRLSIWDQEEQLLPIQKIGQLGLKEFAKIYTVSFSSWLQASC